MSGMCKGMNFKFCMHILSIDRNKSPLQISGKVVGCVVRTLKTFQCTHILGASRSLLCDSSAVLFYLSFAIALWADRRFKYQQKLNPQVTGRQTITGKINDNYM